MQKIPWLNILSSAYASVLFVAKDRDGRQRGESDTLNIERRRSKRRSQSKRQPERELKGRRKEKPGKNLQMNRKELKELRD